jgi:glycosyltransferase involved in cell wall biosynthesis
MKLAIIGTRGIPNNYGGFEQFAEYLSDGLSNQGHDVFVYNSHNHPFQNKKWKKVNIIHCFDPEYKIGTVGQFIYDLNCILDSRKRDFDVVLQLGYTSSSIWNFLFKKNIKIVTNMDGLEWKRTKYSSVTKLFLKYAEKLAVKYSDILVADSIGIKNYLNEKYCVNSTFIPYGATVFKAPSIESLKQFNLEPYTYDMIIARVEPENNVKTIIDGFVDSNVTRKLVVVGNMNTRLGMEIKSYLKDDRVIFLGFISSINVLNNLRYYSNLYFHGHTVGGTNPSLLEAMASNSLICANDNSFNKLILEKHAFYFNSSSDITKIVNSTNKTEHVDWCKINTNKINDNYKYSSIVSQYEQILI